MISVVNKDNDSDVEFISEHRSRDPNRLHGYSWQPFYLFSCESMTNDTPFHCGSGQVTISLADVISTDDSIDCVGNITDILLSNYCWDMDLLMQECPILLGSSIGVVAFHQGPIPRNGKEYCSHWTWCQVELGDQYGTHHSKFALVFYERGIRVCIHTANYYHDLISMTNGAYVRDFPLKSGESVAQSSKFEDELCDYLSHVTVSQTAKTRHVSRLITLIRRYDFSSSDVVLIASVPGRHRGSDLHRWGIGKLEAELRLSQAEPNIEFSGAPAKIFCQVSSIGSMRANEKELHSLAASMCPTTASTVPIEVEVVWPDHHLVKDNLLGRNSLCCYRNALYDDKAQLKKGFASALRLWQPVDPLRQQFLPHIKTYGRYRICDSDSDSDSDCDGHAGVTPKVELAWLLLTSSNLSMAAWGCWEKQRTQLYIKSFEIGVLFLPQLAQIPQSNGALIAKGHMGRMFSCTPSHAVLGLSDWECDGQRSKRQKTLSGLSYRDRNYFRFFASDNQTIPGSFDIHFPIPHIIPAPKYQYDRDVPWTWDHLHQDNSVIPKQPKR